MPKSPESSATPEAAKSPLGTAPAVLGKRNTGKQNTWCPTPDIEFDAVCDVYNPKAISYKEIVKAASFIKQVIPPTEIKRSRSSKKFGCELNYKIENFHRTGSFNERGALYSLQMLTPEQQKAGVITASLGNFATALAYHGRNLNVKVMVVLPASTPMSFVDKCREYKAKVVLHGENLADAKRQAFVLRAEKGNIYINGYDHPHVIAASGTIGIEIMEHLPSTDVILIPVGGGGLLAGVATAAKHLKPNVLIYGIESDKCCSFFKAMENDEPYKTEVGSGLARSLAVPTAGWNAFHTARSLIDKMVLVDDDWISRAILHLVEEEKMIAEGAGATALSPLMALPNVLPELKGKTVVCIVSGGNIDNVTLPRCLERAKAVEGRIIQFTVTLGAEDIKLQLQVMSMIANVGCNVIQYYTEGAWLLENDLSSIYLHLVCETRDLDHACSLKRVMERLFPNIVEFVEEPFSPLPICVCYPKKRF